MLGATDADFQADDFSEEDAWLQGLYERFEPAVPLEAYAADNAPWLTHTTDGQGGWNRKLDYLFTNTAFVAGQTITYQDESTGLATMPLSDHAPLSARWVLAP